MSINESGDIEYWPRQSTHLLNHIVDDMARNRPEAIYAELPLSPTSFAEGFRIITYRLFSNAINGIAWWLNMTLGPEQKFETLAYIGPNDMRHSILLLGAVKVGFKMFFISPHNSTHVQVKLLKQANCTTMLVPTVCPPVVDTIRETYEMRVFHIPELLDLLHQNHPYYPWVKTFDEDRGEPLVVVHTSGTTDLPKPIVWTHDWAASCAEEFYLAPASSEDSIVGFALGLRLFSLMPPYHASHLFMSILLSIYCGNTLIYPLSGLPPSAQMAADCAEHAKVDILALTPPAVEEMGANSEMLHRLRDQIEAVMWTAGDVSYTAGEAISAKIKLFTLCGSTETGLWPTVRRCGAWPKDEWKYMRFHAAMNVRLEHRSDGLFEVIIQRNTLFEYQQPVFRLFPMLQEFNTGDLFCPHPTDQYLWQYRGRIDDIQVFLSEQTFHPGIIERYLVLHANAQGALLIGSGRPQAALLLEMREPKHLEPSERTRAVDEIWPRVEEAMRIVPGHAKVTKEHILFVKPGKPMARSESGTVQRQLTVQRYEEELNELFVSAAAARSLVLPTIFVSRHR